MKKTLFGISAAAIAIAVSTLTTSATSQQNHYETVVFLYGSNWMIVNPAEEGATWDCFDGGTKCRGALKPNSSPNMYGYYDEADVIFSQTNKHYEPI